MRIIYQFLSINFLNVLNKILGLSFFPVSSAEWLQGAAVASVAGALQGLPVQELTCPTLLKGNSSFTNHLKCKLEMGARAVNCHQPQSCPRGEML